MPGRGRPPTPPPPILKRGNGRGSVIPHKGGWKLCLSRPAGSTKQPPYRLFDGSEYDAHKALDAWLDELNGLRPAGVIPTLEQFGSTVWVDYSASNHSAATHGNYLRIFNKEIKGQPIGKLRVDELRASHVNRWTAELMRRGYTRGTIKNNLKVLRQLMKLARLEYALTINPVNADDTPVPKAAPKRSARKFVFFDYDEAMRFVDRCLHPDEELYGPLFATIVMEGLRPGEALALRESAVLWDSDELDIHCALKRDANGHTPLCIGELKTEDSAYRRIDMPPEVRQAIKSQLATKELYGIVAAAPEWEGLIFLPSSGKPPTGVTLNKHLARICARANVRPLPVYDLRHSCATILIENGMSYEDVAWMLGTSIDMLVAHYRHRYGDGPRGLADNWRRVRDHVDDRNRTR